MRQSLSIYRRLLAAQLKSQVQYRISFAMDLFSTGIIVLFEFGSIALVLNRFQHIQGWTLGEVAFLYGLSELSFGLMDMIFSGFDPQRFGQVVRRGAFDQLLLRPVNITVQVLGSDFALRRIGKIVIGLGILILAFAMTEIHWTILKVVYLPIVVGSMVAFFGGLFVIGSTITFWTIESIEVMNILTYGGSFLVSYPMHIYQEWIRRFFTFVVPAVFLTYTPAIFFLDKADPLQLPAYTAFLTPVVGLSVLVLSLLIWNRGLRYYQSTGS